LTIGAAALLLLISVISPAELPTIAALFVAGVMTAASRMPRDVMVKDAAPPGQIGKVFGFVSSGMFLGGADHAGAVRLDHRCRQARSRAGRGRHAIGIEPAVRWRCPNRVPPRAGTGRRGVTRGG
jgi:hypothetical protein